MSACLMQETQPLDDTIVEIDQFRFAEAVYVDLRSHRSPSLKECRAAQLTAWTRNVVLASWYGIDVVSTMSDE